MRKSGRLRQPELLERLLDFLASYDRAAKGAMTFTKWNSKRAELIAEIAKVLE